jgi:tetratricopeptide (TPR) repeat protein
MNDPMKCPRCGAEQAEAAECAACGVIIAKAQSIERPRPKGKQPGSTLIWVGGAVTLLLVFGFWFISKQADRPMQTLGGSVAVHAEQMPERSDGAVEGQAPKAEGQGHEAAGGETELAEPVRPISTTWYEGAEGWAQAAAEHAENSAPLVIYFRADWCPHCRHFEDKTLPTQVVERELARVIKVRVDAERDAQDRQLAKRFGVSGYPDFRVLGSPTDRGRGVPAGSSVDENRFANLLRQEIDYRVSSALAQGGGSIRSLDRALANEPTNPQAWIARGRYHIQRNSLAAAQADLERALALNSESVSALDNLAYCLVKQSKYDEAIERLSALIAIDPGYKSGRAYYQRAVVYRRKGDRPQSMKDAHTACDLGHDEACKRTGR